MPPKVDISKCNGTRLCVELCPNGVLDLVKGIATVVNPEKCVDCGGCQAVSPRGAIIIVNEG